MYIIDNHHPHSHSGSAARLSAESPKNTPAALASGALMVGGGLKEGPDGPTEALAAAIAGGR